jgi:hypothetical protein
MMRFMTDRVSRIAVVSLLLSQAIMLAVGAALHSPAMDDVAHLAAGISNWELGTFDLYKVNPPLVRTIAALPAMAARAKSDWNSYYTGVGARAEFAVMDDFTRANGPPVIWLVTVARWGLIPLMLLGGYVCYRWARELYGGAAGIVALVLWCLCPNVLAYGQILTADAGAAALGVTASYTFWKWLREPAWYRALVAGIVLGLAELTKTTWVVLFGLWPALWVLWRMGSGFGVQGLGKNRKSHDFCYQALRLIVILGLAVFIINAGYGFEGSGTPLRNYLFVSRPLTGGSDGQPVAFGNRFAKTCVGRMSVPLPRNYVEGIDLQWHDIDRGQPSYLRGRWQDRGWWYWYLYALAVKVPLGTWGLLLMAVALRVGHRRRHAPRDELHHTECDDYGGGKQITWCDELALLAPAIVVLVLVSSQTGFSRYIRYVLPIFPFVFIWISSVARCVESKQWKIAIVATALLAWSVGSSLWYTPHWMSYFNELAGGPMGGAAHLIDAQVDWGQDLLYLKKWLDDHPDANPLGLVYFGPIDPTVAGVDFILPPEGLLVSNDNNEIAAVPGELKPGWYAISVNFLYGCPHHAPDGSGGHEWVTRPYYSYFRRFQPVATAGYSIYIYHLTPDDIEAAR